MTLAGLMSTVPLRSPSPFRHHERQSGRLLYAALRQPVHSSCDAASNQSMHRAWLMGRAMPYHADRSQPSFESASSLSGISSDTLSSAMLTLRHSQHQRPCASIMLHPHLSLLFRASVHTHISGAKIPLVFNVWVWVFGAGCA